MTERPDADAPIVLLVQPERDEREMYAEFLWHEGFAPLVVSTATDALALARSVSVIVTGILLPGHMDGIEFVARLRRDERMKRLPLIVLTACAWETDRRRALAAGCDVFLAKPCLPHLLVSEIRRLLAVHGVPTRPAARAPLMPAVVDRRAC